MAGPGTREGTHARTAAASRPLDIGAAYVEEDELARPDRTDQETSRETSSSSGGGTLCRAWKTQEGPAGFARRGLTNQRAGV